MKMLVTGGVGFIGTNLCEELIKEGHSVIALDNLSVSDVNVPHLKKIGVHVVVADIADYESIEKHFTGVDLVFHLAAMNRAQRSIEQPIVAHHTNITGTLHVLEAMRKHHVPKIIFASSSSVYAGREGLLKETDNLSPPHPYGVGKLAAEHYIRVYGELFGIRWVTLRFFSVYGPYQLGDIDKAGVVAKFIHQARTGKNLTVYGDGKQLRNFTFVKDVVKSCILAQNPEAEGHIINIANTKEVAVIELAELVAELTGGKSNIEHLPSLAGDPQRNAADSNLARNVLGYVPQINFKEGIQQTVNWYDKTHKQ